MNTHRRRQSNLCPTQGMQRGYSLIETMVAMIIAAIGITGLSTAVANAHRMGKSADESAVITMAHRTTFSQLRTSLSRQSSSSAAYHFRSGESNSATATSPLTVELQNLVDELSFSFSDIQSAVSCEPNDFVTCEVCFHWYDPVESRIPPSNNGIAQGATNRSTCQIQIV